MKVLIVRPAPGIVDLSKNCYNYQEIGLATAFLELGHEAGIVYHGGNASWDTEYVTPSGKISIYYRKAVVVLKRIAFYENFRDLKDKYDLIISNEYDQIEAVKTLRHYAHKTMIYHGPYYDAYNKRYNLANKIFDFLFVGRMKKYNPIIFTKSRLAKEHLQNKGFDVLDDLGVGLNVSQLHKPKDIDGELASRFEDGNIHMLYIGRLSPRRNTLFLLDVLEKLVKEDPRYRLVMVGKGDPQYLKKISDTITEKALEAHVIHIEELAQDQLPGLYERSDLFLLPTSYEIWGMVLMEAMLFNLPAYTTHNGGSSSLIKDGVNGQILELDVNSWAEAIKAQKFDAAAIKEYNQTILSEKCDWKKIAEKMLMHFNNAHH